MHEALRLVAAAAALLLPVCNGYRLPTLSSSHLRLRAPVVMTGTDRIQAAADKLFSTLDEDGDGSITFTELSTHFSELGYHAKAIDHVFDLLDVNKDGEISPAELRTTFNGLNDAALLQVLGLGESDSDAVFNAIDANGDGEITKAELAAYLEQQGHPASIADSIFNTLDENADGAISRDELHDGYMTYSGLRSLLMPGS